MSYKPGDKVWVVGGPIIYRGGLQDVIEGTYAGTIIKREANPPNDWFNVDIPKLIAPMGDRWVIQNAFLRPRDNGLDKSDWELCHWHPQGVLA